MQFRQEKFGTPSEKSKYIFNLFSSNESRVSNPVFDAAAGQLNLSITGPPCEIVMTIRRTNVSWDNRITYTDSFIGQPRIRGTISILLNCIFTLFLCVWTAFHANIEPKKESGGRITKCIDTLRRWLRKARWSVIIIIFPEVLLIFALFERNIASRICKSIDKSIDQERSQGVSGPGQASRGKEHGRSGHDQKGTPDSDKWSTRPQLGYFALMGGFAIRDHEGLKTLTLDGVYSVCPHLNLTAEELAMRVDDKNRASSLAKCLVVFQVIKMVIQIICRYDAGLSVLLLETHTVIHAVCALMTYVIWFNKPFDIEHPVELKPKKPRKRDSRADVTVKTQKGDTQGEEASAEFKDTGSPPDMMDSYVIRDCKFLQQFPNLKENNAPELERGNSSHLPLEFFTERVGQTKLALMKLDGGEPRDLFNFPNYIWKVHHRLGSHFSHYWLEFLIMSMANFVYGGLHVWAVVAGHFPTPMEKKLWLAALCSTAVGCVGCVLGCVFVSCISCLTQDSVIKQRVFQLKHWKWLFTAFWVAAVVVSAVARLYLVGESFASLRNPSASAFRMVSWANFAIF
jgi:hypothetical protein